MASFPLKCIICPKNHNYSDVSHLLTHIASKSHLSNYFHAQVRKEQDDELASKVRAYDDWYIKNDMEKLLSQRMALKEAKKAEKGRIPSAVGASSRSKAQKRSQVCRTNLKPGLARADQSRYVIDPALADVKVEVDHEAFGPSIPDVYEIGNQRPLSDMSRPLTPPRFEMEMGNTSYPFVGSYCTQPRFPTYQSNGSIHGHSMEQGDPFSNPPMLSPSIRSSPLEKQTNPRVKERWVGRLEKDPSNDLEQTGDEAQSDVSRLKGIIWPGMDLFDAASPKARRMRNQKKENSVLASMQASSELIEPTEVIMYPSWQVKQERFISGEVESSPPPPEPLVDNKRSRSQITRTPLSELNVNVLIGAKKAAFRKVNRSTKTTKARGLSAVEENQLQGFHTEHIFGAKRRRVTAENHFNKEHGNQNTSTLHGSRVEVYRDSVDESQNLSFLDSPFPRNDHNSPGQQIWYTRPSGTVFAHRAPVPDGRAIARPQSPFVEKENVTSMAEAGQRGDHRIPRGVWHNDCYNTGVEHHLTDHNTHNPDVSRIAQSKVVPYHQHYPDQMLNPLSLSNESVSRQFPWWSGSSLHELGSGLKRPRSLSKSLLNIGNEAVARKPDFELGESSGDETIDEGIDNGSEPLRF